MDGVFKEKQLGVHLGIIWLHHGCDGKYKRNSFDAVICNAHLRHIQHWCFFSYTTFSLIVVLFYSSTSAYITVRCRSGLSDLAPAATWWWVFSTLPHLPPNYKCLFWKWSDIWATYEFLFEKKKWCQSTFPGRFQCPWEIDTPRMNNNKEWINSQRSFSINTIQIVLVWTHKAKSHATCASLISEL